MNIGVKFFSKFLATESNSTVKGSYTLIKLGFIPEARMIQYLQRNQYDTTFNKIKKNIYIIISIDADNVFDKIQYVMKSICVKNSQQRV